jgi:hypothetical protein
VRRILRVTSRHWVAGAVWENDGSGWRCVQAAPIIAWMMQCSADEARDRLTLTRYEWEWIKTDADTVPPA